MEEAQKLAELTPKIMNAFHDLGRQHPQKEKLTMRQFQALIILNANETLTVSQLCEKLSLAPSTGTELVNRMISLDYIHKSHQGRDQRQILLSVAPKGMELLQHRRKALAEMFAKFLNPFIEEDRKSFLNSFENIYGFIQKYHL